MLVLGVETSERQGVIALTRDGECLDERMLGQAGRRHAQTLISEVNRLFSDHAVTPQELDLVAVSVGPGSFTGLRVGITFAKTLAYAAGCSLAAVETFQCIAEGAPDDVSRVIVVADAQRSELFVQSFDRTEDSVWEPNGGLEIVERADWCLARAEPDIISGTLPSEVVQELTGKCRVLDEPFRHPQARLVAAIGERQHRVGIQADLWNLEPLYARLSAAEEKWEASRQARRE